MERYLLYSLRSKCHPAKHNFKKMKRGNLYCSLGCLLIEDHSNIFTNCDKLRTCPQVYVYNTIFKEVAQQNIIIKEFMYIEKRRKYLLSTTISPGGATARTRADQAGDTITFTA